MPVHTYTNWNSRPSDREEQVEPYRKYYFICEGANTETFYFEKLIDLRKDLGIHPLKVQGYDELIASIEENDIAAVSNPGFELFLLLHVDGSYEKYIQGHEADFLTMVDGKYAYAYNALLEATGMNAKKNPQIGTLAENVLVAIEQERLINQDIHQLKGRVSSNIGLIIDGIINEEPEI